MGRAKMPSFLLISIILVSSSLGIKVDVVYGRNVGACYFVFGDSYSEAGNNNALQTSSKVNYLPYGIDFLGGIPTGRFTNGLTYVDILTQLIGVDHLIPPFNGLTQHDILEDGVNYASGSAGLLPESGRQLLGMNIWLGQQIENHKLIVSRINESSSKNHLHKCLYTITIGANDYINNYFIPQYYNTSKYYTLEQFTTLLLHQYAGHIKDLHDLGARKIAIYGLGYLGCAPAIIAYGTNGSDSSVCVEKVKSAVLRFNYKLVKLIDELNCKFKDSKFTYINTTSIIPFTVPCYFIFGDSLSDSGNNNDLNTRAKVNYAPYGIDFPDQKATGRFSNGRTVVDIIAEHLGFDHYIPPFASASGPIILQGVNYASGAAGIRSETSQHLGGRISLAKQMQNHRTTISRIAEMLQEDAGSSAASSTVHEYLGKCLYTINIGSNDYMNNYFLPKYYMSSKHYSPKQYAEALIHDYTQQIKILYELGARKVAVFGLGPLGCAPEEIEQHGILGLCANKVNHAAGIFNRILKPLVDELNQNLPGANFTYINSLLIQTTSSVLGFTVFNAPCCTVNSDGQCEASGSICHDRRRHVFWDNFHPTDALNVFSGGRAYKAVIPLDVHPVDISTLVQL